MKALIIFFLMAPAVPPVRAGEPSAPLLSSAAERGAFNITLKAAEDNALSSSDQYKSARLSAEAARAAADASGSLLYPRLGLEGSLKYLETIPTIKLPAVLGGPKPLGDNWNYSMGPAAYWTLDGGTLRAGRETARKTASARSAEAENARRQVLLKTRAAYFGVQLALERVYLIGENLQLSLSQLKDIELGVKAGSRSRLDGIRSRQEVTARRRDLLRARAELSAMLRDFSFITGLPLPPGKGLPLDARLAARDYAADARMLVRAEPYEEILHRFLPAADKAPGKALPAVTAFSDSAAAYRAAAGGYKAEKFPRLTFSARSSIDYPNGPNLYSFLQNSAGLSLSLPLFESGSLAEREKESRLNAEAADAKRDEAAVAADRDFDKALDEYNALMEEQLLNIEAVDDAQDASKLAYEAYKAGGGTWLEVESANLKALQAKTTAASANAGILMQLALMDSLSDQP